MLQIYNLYRRLEMQFDETFTHKKINTKILQSNMGRYKRGVRLILFLGKHDVKAYLLKIGKINMISDSMIHT